MTMPLLSIHIHSNPNPYPHLPLLCPTTLQGVQERIRPLFYRRFPRGRWHHPRRRDLPLADTLSLHPSHLVRGVGSRARLEIVSLALTIHSLAHILPYPTLFYDLTTLTSTHPHSHCSLFFFAVDTSQDVVFDYREKHKRSIALWKCLSKHSGRTTKAHPIALFVILTRSIYSHTRPSCSTPTFTGQTLIRERKVLFSFSLSLPVILRRF